MHLLQDCPGPFENALKHRLRQFSGERVLLAGMVRANQSHTIGQNNRRAVAKARSRFGNRSVIFLIRRKKRVESDLSQSDDHANGLEQFELLNEVRPTARKFNCARFVIWRRAPDSSSNVTIRKPQTVISINGVRLIGESSKVQRAVKPVTAPIACEYSAGSIAAVRRRCQSDNQKTRIRVPETR